jgi:nucleoside-diphosphate-sugar epimerase
MSKRHAVVVGGLGVIGRALVGHLTSVPSWDVVALSRRAPDFDTTARFLSVDLRDKDTATAALAELKNTTHVFYAAYQPMPTRAKDVDTNLALLTNAVEALSSASSNLEHVNLMEGGKWYGFHLGPTRTPALEDDPRHMPLNFYYSQQDWLEEAATRDGFAWSALRPEAVCGFALGNPMNLTMAIAVYAAICGELGVPFSFPGKPGAWTALYEVTDARILAQAAQWAATTPSAAGEAFNITNGDYFRWCNLWPKFADMLSLRDAEPRQLSLTEFRADKAPVWDRIVAKQNLKPHAYSDIVSWEFADSIFSAEWDVARSTLKARRYGFTPFIESDRMFAELFVDLQRNRIIPSTLAVQ